MVTLHEVITFLVSMQISISSLQTHNVNRCGRSRHLARKLSRSEERFSRNAETDLVCRLLLEKKKGIDPGHFLDVMVACHASHQGQYEEKAGRSKIPCQALG